MSCTNNLQVTVLVVSALLSIAPKSTQSSAATPTTVLTSTASSSATTSATASTKSNSAAPLPQTPSTKTETTPTTTTKPKDCNSVDMPTNGQTTYSDSSGTYAIDTVVTYTCIEGYDLIGNTNRTCTGTGNWTGNGPSCEPKDCDAPNTITNGNVTYDETTVNSTAMYSCNRGYNLSGDATITCQTDGTWQKTTASCSVIEQNYNDTCLEDGPEQQCKTVNASCILIEDRHTCRCVETDYYHHKNNTCYRRISYGQACIRENGDEQCKTFNSSCYGDGDAVHCLCEEVNYYIDTNDICAPRPVAPEVSDLLIDRRGPTTNSIPLRWTVKDANKLFNIYIEWTPESTTGINSTNQTWNAAYNDYDVENLKSGTLYTFFLYLTKDGIRTVLMDTLRTYTIPEPVQVIHLTNIYEENMTVTWDNDVNRTCLNYNISINDSIVETVPRSNDPAERFILTNLTGGTYYVISVVAIVPGLSSSTKMKGGFTRPQSASDASITKVHATSITLQIEFTNETHMDGYHIYVFPNIPTEYGYRQAKENVVTFKDLDPSTQYTFRIFTYIKNPGSEDYLQSEGYLSQTHYTRPLPPDSLSAMDILENSLYLQWTINSSYIFDEFIIEYFVLTSHNNTTWIRLDNKTIMDYPIDNLTSGTGYQFNLYTSINGTQSETPATYSVYTKPVVPPQPSVVRRTDTNITIQFPNDKHSYSKYLVNETYYERGNGTITIHDLHAGTSYTFVVFSIVNYTITSLENITFENFTRPAPPFTIDFPENNLTETALQVLWEPDESSNVDGFVVYLSHMKTNYNRSQNVSSDTTSAFFTNLTAGIEYTTVIYSYWKGEISYLSTKESIYTRPTAPVASISDVTKSSLTLQLEESEDNWDEYMIKLSPGLVNNTEVLQKAKDLFPYTFHQLVAGTNYTIEMFSIIGDIRSLDSLIISSYTKPDDVQTDTINVDKLKTTSTTLFIKWEAPSNGSVDNYEVTYYCQSPNSGEVLTMNYTRRSEDTSSSVWGLDPGTFCSVNITTVVGKQTGIGVQKNLDWSTDEIAPPAVEEMNVTSEATRLYVTWKNPSKPNGIIRKYVVDVIDVKQSCSIGRTNYACTGCKDMSNSKCGIQHSDILSALELCGNSQTEVNKTFEQSYQHEHIVTDLHPYRNYAVVVTPYTRCYGQNFSTTKLTKQAAPTGPPTFPSQSVIETTEDTLVLSWQPPIEDKQNGIITNYTVYYSYKNRTCFGDEEGIELKGNKTVDAAKKNTSISNRFPFWSYNVSITAWTEIGEGPPSEPVVMMTMQSVPDRIRSNPNVTNTTQSTLQIQWEPPCLVNGIISSYQIQVIDVNRTEVTKNFTTNSNETNNVIGDLFPYHNYTVGVAAVNTDGQQGPVVNLTTTARTDTGEPHSATNIKVAPVSATTLHVTWTRPDLYTGVTKYNVTAKDVRSSQEYTSQSYWDFELTEIDITDLDEFWNYTVTVTAITSAGENTSLSSDLTRTLEAAPGKVTGLTLTKEEDVTLPRAIRVNWTEPVVRDLNGILTAYFIRYKSQDVDATESVKENDRTLNIPGIQPGNYSISVFAANGAGNGTVVSKSIVVPPGAPIRKPENKTNPLMTVSSQSTSIDDQTQISINLPIQFLCDSSNGSPRKFGIIVVAADKASDDAPFVGDLSGFNKKVNSSYKNWFQVRDSTHPDPYITTHETWNPCNAPKQTRRRRSVTQQTFKIGDEGDCSDKAGNNTYYCNGKLQPDASYRVKSFSCTDGGCSETLYSRPIKTSKVDHHQEPTLLVPIVASVVSVVVVMVIVIVTVIYLRRRQAACFAKSAEDGFTHSRSEPMPPTEMLDRGSSVKVFRPHAIQLSEFPDCVDKMRKDSGLIFSEAYRMVRENSPQHPMTIAESQNSRPKNRYTNILPFDHSRVKLLPLDDDEGSDYINASYIPGYTSRREYIATQGPMPATFDDFWRMVWEQNVEIIVMLTKLVEKGRNKCDRYWPNQNEPQFYGDLSVSVMSESNLSDYTIRIMEVKLGCKQRKVKQFHFLKWPDYGCPSRTWPIINFIAMVRQYRPPFSSGPLLAHCRNEKRTVKQISFLKWPDMGCPEYPELLLDFVKNVRQHGTNWSLKRPMIVHCSAGVGRTGTFIAVDHLLQHIRDHDDVDVYSLVLEMRNNRCNMVQTEDQYVYIHECIKEFITHDDDEDEDDDDDQLYMNAPTENVYENTAFSRHL